MKIATAAAIYLTAGLAWWSSAVASECDVVLVVEGLLPKTTRDSQAAALQLLTAEKFNDLKTKHPDLVVGPFRLAEISTFEELSRVRSQIARRYTYAYGSDSARATVLASVGPETFRAWATCEDARSSTTPGLHAWISELSATSATVSVTFRDYTSKKNTLSIRGLAGYYFQQSFEVADGDKTSLSIERIRDADRGLLISAAGFEQTLVVPRSFVSVIPTETEIAKFEKRKFRGNQVFMRFAGGSTRTEVSCSEPNAGWTFDVDSAQVIVSAKGDNLSGSGASMARLVESSPQRICFELLARPSFAFSEAYISAYLEASEFRPIRQDIYQLCIGDLRADCPREAVNLDCGASPEVWAQSKCPSFSVRQLSAKSGGRCGYSVFQVTCQWVSPK